MPTDPTQLSLLGLVIAIGGAGLRKMWVWGWTYAEKDDDLTEMTKDRDFWRDTALRALGHTDKALDLREKVEGA